MAKATVYRGFNIERGIHLVSKPKRANQYFCSPVESLYRYLHKDGTLEDSTFDADGNDVGWFDSVDDVKKAVDLYYESL